MSVHRNDTNSIHKKSVCTKKYIYNHATTQNTHSSPLWTLSSSVGGSGKQSLYTSIELILITSSLFMVTWGISMHALSKGHVYLPGMQSYWCQLGHSSYMDTGADVTSIWVWCMFLNSHCLHSGRALAPNIRSSRCAHAATASPWSVMRLPAVPNLYQPQCQFVKVMDIRSTWICHILNFILS